MFSLMSVEQGKLALFFSVMLWRDKTALWSEVFGSHCFIFVMSSRAFWEQKQHLQTHWEKWQVVDYQRLADKAPCDRASWGVGWLEAVAYLAELATLSITPRNYTLKSGYFELISEESLHLEVNVGLPDLRLALKFRSVFLLNLWLLQSVGMTLNYTRCWNTVSFIFMFL